MQALTIKLFSLGFQRASEDAPWLFSFSIPAGAIGFLINERRERNVPAPAAVEAAEPQAGPPPTT